MADVFSLSNADGPMFFSRQFISAEPYKGPGAKRGDYIVLEDFWVAWTTTDRRTFRIRIPKGLITDFASIPRFAWSLSGLTPDGLYRNAAAIHDPGYMWQGDFPEGWFQEMVEGEWANRTGKKYKWTRDELDRLFLRIMKACDVDVDTRTVMYEAVHLFGWWAWIHKDKDREQYRTAFYNR